MIVLSINGRKLSLREDTTLRVEWVSPFFSGNGIPGVISYPIWVSLSGENSEILGYPQRPANTKRVNQRIKGATLSIGSSFQYTGVIIITNGNDRAVEVTFLGETANFNDVSEKSIKSFSYGGTHTILPATIAGVKAHMLAASLGTADTFNWVWAPMIFGPFDIVNMFDANAGVFDDSTFTSISPYPYLTYVIRSIFEESGYTVGGSFLQNEEIKSISIFTVLGENYASFAVSPNISISSLLPDVTVGDFLNDLVDTFNIAIFFEPGTKNVLFEPFDTMYNNPDYLDWTVICAPGRYQNYSFDEGEAGYKFIQNEDESDLQAPGFNLEFTTGVSPYKEVSTDIVPTAVSSYTVPGFGYDWLTPEVQPDNSLPNWFDNFSPAVRLFFYRGYQAASAPGSSYPLITPFDKKFGGVDITGAKSSLMWEGNNGLFNRFWKNFIKVKDFGLKKDFPCQPSEANLKEFSFFRKIRIGNIEHCPAKLTFTSTTTKIKQALLETYVAT
ncbi:hypothetical protein QQ054_32205 [Oscillatoria amoena NRMC-F 0135]|nr:hypothetical protein [Oscillatoria amoena NRMC-F 0135]